jgi:hypothetical protein
VKVFQVRSLLLDGHVRERKMTRFAALIATAFLFLAVPSQESDPEQRQKGLERRIGH